MAAAGGAAFDPDPPSEDQQVVVSVPITITTVFLLLAPVFIDKRLLANKLEEYKSRKGQPTMPESEKQEGPDIQSLVLLSYRLLAHVKKEQD